MRASLEMLFDRISIVLDCADADEANRVWDELLSQALDKGQITIPVSLKLTENQG